MVVRRSSRGERSREDSEFATYRSKSLKFMWVATEPVTDKFFTA